MKSTKNRQKNQSSNVSKKRTGSIKVRLVGTIVPIIILSIVVILSWTYSKSEQIISENAEQLLTASTKEQAASVGSWAKENLSVFKTVKKTLEHANFTKKQELSYLSKFLDEYESFPLGIYIGSKDGEFLDASGWVPDKDYVVAETDWYKEGVTHKDVTYGAAYLDNNTGDYIFSATALLDDGSGKDRVMAADVSLKSASEIVTSSNSMEYSKSLLVEKSSNTILASDNEEFRANVLDTSNSDELLAGIASKISSQNYEPALIHGYMVSMQPIDGTDWLLISYIQKATVLSKLTQLRTYIVILAIITILILAFVTIRVIHYITKPIKSLTNTIVAMTQGDFTPEVQVNGNDEITLMSESIKNFIEVMRNTITDIISVSEQLSSQSKNSTSVSESLKTSAITQADSMNNLNTIVDELGRAVEEIAESATSLAIVVSETGEDGTRVNAKMQETVSVTEQGRADMNHVGEAMQTIETSMNALETAINKVGESAKEITNIVELIGNISEETNLLSLNASIEAARAGEAGRGFSIVASEIGKLAATSSDAVQNISGLINEISSLITDTVQQTQNSVHNIKESSLLIHTACDTFDTIYNTINETNSIVKDMIQKVQKVDDVASSVAAITEEQAASANEIMTASNVMLEQASNITNNSELVAKEANELYNTSEKLSSEVEIFKVK
ncbi:methyl-accepting chemotaxis protein [Velocimicrobium porci]|uniref:Methyl-accepting chemotaxis protein n=1 Tax=Velocimicrobium porci TaxID=2606634 RepID=A0A6L5XX81_9FIRM|nr:methyl-accepting chemotaxis protein [Velocimicrobium porci]MSS63234.1 methyl-accepting chemotaxis protein [Velocimicrobium porci]